MSDGNQHGFTCTISKTASGPPRMNSNSFLHSLEAADLVYISRSVNGDRACVDPRLMNLNVEPLDPEPPEALHASGSPVWEGKLQMHAASIYLPSTPTRSNTFESDQFYTSVETVNYGVFDVVPGRDDDVLLSCLSTTSPLGSWPAT